MNNLNIHTNGKPIVAGYSVMSFHPKLNSEMAYLDLQIGELQVSIQFETHNEMIDFCDNHCFPYKDNRNKPRLDGQNNEGDLVDNS